MEFSKKYQAQLYSSTLYRKKPVLLKVKPAQYLAIEGQGKGGSAEFQAGIGALNNVAFNIKMTRKFAGKQDYGVCKVECLWRRMRRGRTRGTVCEAGRYLR